MTKQTTINNHPFDTSRLINISKVDLVAFAKEVYNLSIPRGLGFLHFKQAGLSDTDAKSLINPTEQDALDMDYVHGRGCKMNVWRSDDGNLWIADSWYDHTIADLATLLSRFGIDHIAKPHTGTNACECADCLEQRRGR